VVAVTLPLLSGDLPCPGPGYSGDCAARNSFAHLLDGPVGSSTLVGLGSRDSL
jgi:hypothetical protein